MGLLLVGLAGCDPQHIDFYSCEQPDPGHKDPRGKPDPCHRYQAPDGEVDAGEDGGPVEPMCEVGEYVHWWHGWDSPSWLWIGDEAQAPECPNGAPSVSYEGRADLVAPTLCEACTCDPPTGSCALPLILTASSLACNIPGGATASFNAPDPWDGSCDGTTQVPGGAANSLTIDPIKMTEDGCAVGMPIAAKVVSLHWNTFARACDVQWPMGPTDRSICLQADLAPPGFALCIFHEDDLDCPTDPGNMFTERHVFYRGVQDDRQCSPCACGAPAGSACTAMLSIYKGADLTCSGQALARNTITSEKSICIDIALAGQALGSKSAGPTTYLPGTCPPLGGDGSGTAIPTHPATLCCRP
jgi:hypothetical protein